MTRFHDKQWWIYALLWVTLPFSVSQIEAGEQGLYYFRNVEAGAPKSLTCDVAIYGGTPAGLSNTDIGKKESIGGLAKEFYTRAGRITGFRSSKAETPLLDMLDEAGVEVLFDRIAVQDVSYEKLRLRLLADGQLLN